MSFEEITQLVGKISYKDWVFHLSQRADCVTLQLRFLASDTHTGMPEMQYCRKWFISSHATRNEVIRTCYLAVEIAERHELCESFRFNNVRVNNPHLDVEALASAMTLLSRLGTDDTRQVIPKAEVLPVTLPSKNYVPAHPGTELCQLINKHNVSIPEMAEKLELTGKHLHEMLDGKQPLSIVAALKLESNYPQFGLPAEYWVRLQADYALHKARKP